MRSSTFDQFMRCFALLGLLNPNF